MELFHMVLLAVVQYLTDSDNLTAITHARPTSLLYIAIRELACLLQKIYIEYSVCFHFTYYGI